MTDVSHINGHAQNFFDSILNQNIGADGGTKVMLDARGNITESRESRGHIFGRAINKTLTEKTQVSVNVLRNALVGEIGAKGLEIFNRFVSAKNISGKKRLTLDNLRNIKAAVNEYKASLVDNANKRLDLTQIKRLGHKNTYYCNTDITSACKEFMSLCNTHMAIRNEIGKVGSLIDGIPKDFTSAVMKGDRAFANLETILNDAKTKLNLCKENLDTLLRNVRNKIGDDFKDATPNDAENLQDALKVIKPKIDTIINGLNAKIQD